MQALVANVRRAATAQGTCMSDRTNDDGMMLWLWGSSCALICTKEGVCVSKAYRGSIDRVD